MKQLFLSLLLVLGGIACMSTSHSHLEYRAEPFGEGPDGLSVTRMTLTNQNGMVAVFTDLGATLVELHVPDRDGRLADVVLASRSPLLR